MGEAARKRKAWQDWVAEMELQPDTTLDERYTTAVGRILVIETDHINRTAAKYYSTIGAAGSCNTIQMHQNDLYAAIPGRVAAMAEATIIRCEQMRRAELAQQEIIAAEHHAYGDPLQYGDTSDDGDNTAE